MLWLWGGRYVTTENAYVKADIAQISAEIAGRVNDVLVQDHAEVRAGDMLLTLDREPFRVALAKAEAELDATRAPGEHTDCNLARGQERAAGGGQQGRPTGTRSSRARRPCRSAASSPPANTRRSRATPSPPRIAPSVMRKKIERMAAQLGGNPERPIDQHPMVREKQAERERAELDLARTIIRAPLDGTAVNVRLQKGEQIKAATVLFALVAHTRPWVEANFKETELTHVRKGLAATIELDTYPGVVWQAEVDSISPATGAEFALLPPQNASGNWVKVVQRLPVRLRLIPQPGEPPLRAGMTASVKVDTGRERSLSSLLGSWKAFATAQK